MTHALKLVLFDIDGTILRTDGAGRRAMEGALTNFFGSAGSPHYRYDGKTDRQIVRDLMREAGHDDEAIDGRMPELLDHYLDGLERELATVDVALRCLDGVVPLIDALESRDDRAIGLLTGNLEGGARAKLRAVGIDPARFRINAFGSDSEVRADLPAVAQRRARELMNLTIAAEHIVVIGDTPADIECTRALGARTIAVATGRYSVDELLRYEPAAALEDLCDTEQVLRAIDAA